MTVMDLVKLEKSGATFQIIDAREWYMVTPTTLIKADGDAVAQRFGEWEVVGFSAERKQKIAVYVKPKAE